jgi:hypothetical protein
MGNPLELVVIRVIGVEVKPVSDHPLPASTGRKIVCSLARLRSWTSGQLEEEFCAPLPLTGRAHEERRAHTVVYSVSDYSR